MLPLHHMRYGIFLILVYEWLGLDCITLHPARLERTVYSSEVRRVTNYARSAVPILIPEFSLIRIRILTKLDK